MTKEDYMRLPKERLAELLALRDTAEEVNKKLMGRQESPNIIVQQWHPMCYEPGGTCTNPFHDCVNCPRTATTGGTWTMNTQGTDIK